MSGQAKFEIGSVISSAWNIFMKNVGVFIGALLVTFFVNGIINVFTSSDAVRESVLLSMTGSLLSFVITGFLGIGMMKIVLDAIDGKNPTVGTLFKGSPWIVNYLLASFITGIVIGLGFLLLIIPGIYLAIKLAYTSYFIIDQNMSATDAMSASWKATAGSELSIFIFGLLAIVLAILGVMALGIGLLVAIPVIGIATGLIYRALIATQPVMQAPVPPVAPMQS